MKGQWQDIWSLSSICTDGLRHFQGMSQGNRWQFRRQDVHTFLRDAATAAPGKLLESKGLRGIPLNKTMQYKVKCIRMWPWWWLLLLLITGRGGFISSYIDFNPPAAPYPKKHEPQTHRPCDCRGRWQRLPHQPQQHRQHLGSLFLKPIPNSSLAEATWMSQEVSKKVSNSVGYNLNISHLWVGEITHWS